MDEFGTSLADDPRTEADDTLDELYLEIARLRQFQLNTDADGFQSTYEQLARRLGELDGVQEDNVTHGERDEVAQHVEIALKQIRAILPQD